MNISDPLSFGALLRRYRLAAGITQQALAERAGLSERAVNDLERDPQRTPRLETVTLLAQALNLDTEHRGRLLAAARPAAPMGAAAVDATLAARSLDVAPLRVTPLPAPPDHFIGRAREVAEVSALLRDPGCRLLTLTGPGGIGKTRLSLRVASDMDEAFPDGVFFVALGGITDSALVMRTVAAALGIRESAAEAFAAQVAEALRTRRALLILDNFEQVLAAAVEVERMLAACPEVTALVTSRSPLHLAREREYPAPPLTLPDQTHALSPEECLRSDAVALLAQCARAARPDFTVSAANSKAVADICARLDGMPLPIQLAAARIKHLSLAELLARLDQQLAVLTGGPRDAPERQRTVRATLDWSYHLLTTSQQTLLRRLAVFIGGWSLDAAEAVCAGESVAQTDVLDLLGGLVDQSLVQVEERDGFSRYRMLEPVRQYAEEKLRDAGEEAWARDRHLAWMMAEGERLKADGWIMIPWSSLRRIRFDGENLRAALAWSRQRDPSGALTLKLAGTTYSVWVAIGSIGEGRQILRDALANSDATTPDMTRAYALISASGLAGMQTDFAEIELLAAEASQILTALGEEKELARYRIGIARAITRMWPNDQDRLHMAHEESLRLSREFGGPNAIAESLYFWADFEVDRGNYESARRDLEESLQLCRQAGNAFLVSFPLITLARVACAEGNFVQARALAEEALELREGLTWSWVLAVSLVSLGEVERCAWNDVRAEELFTQALTLYQADADEPGIAWTRHNLGHLALRAGEIQRATELFTQALAARYRHRYPLGVAAELAALAGVASAMGRAALAARLVGAAEALLENIQSALAPADRLIFDATIAGLQATMEPADFAAARAEGRAIAWEDAVAEALRLD